MFNRTRLKLTAWYLLIIMFVSIFFSAIIYQLMSVEIERFERVQRLRIERRLPLGPNVPITNPELLQETRHRILIELIDVNLIILVVSGALGYILAGRTLKPIKEMLDEQNRFISDASHELRTPLTSLKTAMEVSQRDKSLDLPNAKKLIGESIDEVNKLQSLSEQLLHLTSYDKNNGNLKFESLSLLAIVKEAVKKVQPIAKQKQIGLINKTIDHKIQGSSYELSDLFIILLDNAIKYSPKKSKVFISCEKKDKSIYIYIKDQGMGIEPKDIAHIFDRFYRADDARSKTSSGGYGLGLAIAKKIVGLHRGEISVKSAIGEGSTFTVRLPIFS